MLVSPDYRVQLSTQSAAATPELEAVFVGAAQATPNYAAATTPLAAAAQLGFPPPPGDQSLTALPLAFTANDTFTAVFPNDTGWLARAVRDYFNAGGKRAWVVRVAPGTAPPLDAYLRPFPPLTPDAPPTGVEIALQVPSAGLLVLPDLEYMCLASTPAAATLPASLPPEPAFRPAADFAAPPAPATPSMTPALAVSAQDVVGRVSVLLAATRRDMLCLFALPVGADPTATTAMLVTDADTILHGPKPLGPDIDPDPRPDRIQVQAFAPLVRDPISGAIASPSGTIAGMLCAAAATDGVWRSLAGRALPAGYTPLRRIESNALAALRSSGVNALCFAGGGTVLDDDILGCHDTPANAVPRAAGTQRLMGWLLRNLQSYGQQLVFENVLDDGRVELTLTSLFATLLKRGALNGTRVTDAVSIKRRDLGRRDAVAFDIAVNAAVAVETIRLRFLDGAVTASLGAA